MLAVVNLLSTGQLNNVNLRFQFLSDLCSCPLSPVAVPCSHAVLRNEESMRSRCPNASRESEMSCSGKWQGQDCIYLQS